MPSSISPMGNKLLEVGKILINENGPTQNPWECHFYRHQIKTETNEYYIKTINWSVNTNIPLSLSIDNNGLISGNIAPLTTEQPGISDSDLNPKEQLKEDGSNWNKIGRYSNPFKDFVFTVNWTIKEYKDKTKNATKTEIITLSANYTIKVIRNNDIDNLIFCVEYLKSGWSLNLNINGEEKKYTKDNIEEYLRDNTHLTKWDCWKE